MGMITVGSGAPKGGNAKGLAPKTAQTIPSRGVKGSPIENPKTSTPGASLMIAWSLLTKRLALPRLIQSNALGWIIPISHESMGKIGAYTGNVESGNCRAVWDMSSTGGLNTLPITGSDPPAQSAPVGQDGKGVTKVTPGGMG